MDAPPLDELADDDDTLDWSWDRLANGARTTLSDEDAVGVALFAGVPEDEREAHAAALRELGRH